MDRSDSYARSNGKEFGGVAQGRTGKCEQLLSGCGRTSTGGDNGVDPAVLAPGGGWPWGQWSTRATRSTSIVPEVETKPRGHRPIDRHRAFSGGIPATITFLHARTFIIVERESSTLDDVRVSIETRLYVTDLTEAVAFISTSSDS